MTKKDYISLAAALMEARGREGGDRDGNAAIDRAAMAMASVFWQDNPNFDPSRWYAAAGVKRTGQ